MEYRKTIFETEEWIKTLMKSYDYKRYTAGDTTLLQVKSKIFGNRLISLPFSDYGKLGPVDEKEVGFIVDEAGASYVEIRIPEWRDEILKTFYENGFLIGVTYKTFLLNISENWEKMWKNLNKKIRNSIRYALKNEVKIRSVKEEDDLKIFYNLYERHNSGYYPDIS